MDLERGIGKNNDLLWHLPSDMRFFKETTTNHVVVMGRKNFESIPEKYRPLPNRENAVLTRNRNFKAAQCSIFHSLEECLVNYRTTDQTVFIIGGGQIYKEAIALEELTEMYITQVDTTLEADTFFPEIEIGEWKKEMILNHPKDDKNPFSFKVFKFQKN